MLQIINCKMGKKRKWVFGFGFTDVCGPQRFKKEILQFIIYNNSNAQCTREKR